MKNKPPGSLSDRPQGSVSGEHQLPGARGGMGLFTGLVLAVSLLVGVLLVVLWLVPTLGFAGIHPWLPALAAFVCLLAVAGLVWVGSAFAWHAHTGRPVWGLGRLRGLVIRFFLPLAEQLGRVSGFSVEAVRRSFIEVNNRLVQGSGLRCPADKVLILLPHCLQATACKHRLIHNADNCTRCGACVHGGLLALRDRWGVQMAMATGGTVARRIVVQTRPRLILAVACERDLASGIQDTYPLPVYGVLNARPNGPCVDTTVALGAVEDALRFFVSNPPAKAPADSQSEAQTEHQ